MHYTPQKVSRIKDRIIEKIDEGIEYEKLLKKVAKDIKRGRLGQGRYGPEVIRDARQMISNNG